MTETLKARVKHVAMVKAIIEDERALYHGFSCDCQQDRQGLAEAIVDALSLLLTEGAEREIACEGQRIGYEQEADRLTRERLDAEARVRELEQEVKQLAEDYSTERAMNQDVRALKDSTEARVQELEVELAAEHETSRNDPAEQRAERYALEAVDLTERLIKAEAALARAEQERDLAKANALYHADCRPNRQQAKAALADAKALNDWRADVTVALGRPGGAFYADVPKHIREMRRVLERAGYRYCDIPACNCGGWHLQKDTAEAAEETRRSLLALVAEVAAEMRDAMTRNRHAGEYEILGWAERLASLLVVEGREEKEQADTRVDSQR